MSKSSLPLSTLGLVTRLSALGLFFGYIALQVFVAQHLLPGTSHGRPGWLILLLLLSPILLLKLLPYIFYCLALWSASGVFSGMARGEAFAPAVTRGLKSMGWSLVRGAFVGIFISPTLSALMLMGRPGGAVFDHEIPESTVKWMHMQPGGFWAHYVFSVEALTLGLVGLALLALSTQALRLRGELEQFV